MSMFNINSQLNENLPASSSISRTNYADNWSQALNDDYAKKSMEIDNLTERLNLVANELHRTQMQLVSALARIAVLEP